MSNDFYKGLLLGILFGITSLACFSMQQSRHREYRQMLERSTFTLEAGDAETTS